jgi:hypothetical protein
MHYILWPMFYGLEFRVQGLGNKGHLEELGKQDKAEDAEKIDQNKGQSRRLQ